MNGCSLPLSSGSEKRVDERGQRRAAQEDQGAEEEDHGQHRQHPPLSVVPQESHEFGQESGTAGFGELLEVSFRRVLVHAAHYSRIGWSPAGVLPAQGESHGQVAGKTRFDISTIRAVDEHRGRVGLIGDILNRAEEMKQGAADNRRPVGSNVADGCTHKLPINKNK